MSGCLILLNINEPIKEGDDNHHIHVQKYDVLTAVPDWWHPGSLDMADGNTLFIYCPDMDASEAQMRLCNSELGDHKDNPHLRWRSVSLIPDLFPHPHHKSHHKIKKLETKRVISKGIHGERAHADIWAEAKEKGFFITLKKSELLSAKRPKPPIVNPISEANFNPFVIT